MNTTTAAADATILRALLDGIDCKIRGNKVAASGMLNCMDVRDALVKADLRFKEAFDKSGCGLRFTVL